MMTRNRSKLDQRAVTSQIVVMIGNMVQIKVDEIQLICSILHLSLIKVASHLTRHQNHTFLELPNQANISMAITIPPRSNEGRSLRCRQLASSKKKFNHRCLLWTMI